MGKAYIAMLSTTFDGLEISEIRMHYNSNIGKKGKNPEQSISPDESLLEMYVLFS